MPSPVIYDPSTGKDNARAIIASDTALGSGVVRSGSIGDAAVLSGSIGSGQISSGHLASGLVANLGASLTSGSVQSGHIGDAAVLSGSIGSGQIASGHLASGLIANLGSSLTSGSVQSGHVASGVVGGFFGPTRHIQSGTVGVFDLGSGAVVAGAVGSGAVRSGNIASGSVGGGHIADYGVGSGDLASGAVHGEFNIASGTITYDRIVPGAIEEAAVLTEGSFRTNIAGLAVGAVLAVKSGNVSSGLLVMADPKFTGRMPGLGLLTTDPGAFAGDIGVSMRHEGRHVFASGVYDAELSGATIGSQLFVSLSGRLTATAPSVSGVLIQRMGVLKDRLTGSGGVVVFLKPSLDMIQVGV